MACDPLCASGRGTGLDHPPSYWVATAGPEPEDDGALMATICPRVLPFCFQTLFGGKRGANKNPRNSLSYRG